MAPIRIDCPACHQPVQMSSHGRRVRTIPDTWTPNQLEGAA